MDCFIIIDIADLNQREVSNYGEISKLMSIGNAHR